MDNTHIVILMDRSGSMERIKKQAETSLKEYLQEQKEVEGDADVSFYKFNHEFEIDYQNIPIKEAVEPQLEPTGRTALYDSIGKVINIEEEKLNNLINKPDKCLFIIITDGIENASENYDNKSIKKLLDNKRKDDWSIIFVCSDENQMQDAKENLGFASNFMMSFSNNDSSVSTVSANLSSYTARYRKSSNSNLGLNTDEQNADK